MDKVLTVEDFRAWGRIGGNKRVENQGPKLVQAQAVKANRASIKSRQLKARLAKQAIKSVSR
jgi:hypothetical protein